ncbi:MULTISPECIES: alpha/beta hydrolase [unclassified Enterococcus]|uniref:alpha/beta fold hydrolase n=1 Tax=unclassified Enterococcus TaxID=2608891 RepID=UPI0015546299|nr:MULTISPECIES: alpha/beta hydrolase [unclassified Enterococcus]MBS7576463.1 alpha/beta hydrolase [Enterococcus sp. MMGLQ5-2]MBS7583695.1 alpha/beta hydrolase [Enterococcus sp. MMGLQ5-1]NPD11556.1 alpha/beta hydrolase [Enterococcus sp. MMGLQ5-1]NPD36300.1 alpha/beta hydrolase [Enterococcus sp. MMGLQ5-2]
MKFITSDQETLNYSITGQGIPIIFVAGYSGNAKHWSAQNEFFLANSYQVIHLDKRGHGENRTINSGLRMSRLATDIHELVKKLKLGKFHLVAHSMGCAITWEYLSLFGSQAIYSLTLLDDSPKPINTPEWQFGLKDLTWQKILEAAKQIPETKLVHHKIDTRLLKAMNQSAVAFDLNQTKPLLLDFLTRDYRDIAFQTELPQLFVSGEYSPLFKKEQAEFLAQQAINGYALIAQDCGHIPQSEHPELVNPAILTFIRQAEKEMEI